MDLSAYLARIGYGGPLRADAETLRAVHRAHLLAIPYEAIDVQLGRSLTPDVGAAYDKIVERGRGGWCYEMNGLFGWVLGEIGFSVTRLSSGPQRPYSSEREIGNHLINRVDIDGEAWIADVGYGDGPLEPYRLREGEFTQRNLTFRIDTAEDGWLRFNNHEFGLSPAFYFKPDLGDEALLAERCRHLQSADDSPFVLNLVAIRHTERGVKSLVGRKVRQVEDGAPRPSRMLNSAAELEKTLTEEFGIRTPEGVKDLWPKVCARHEELFGEKTASA